MTEAMPFLQKYDITFLRPPAIWGREKCGNIKMISNDGARGLDTMCAPTAKIILRMMTSHRRYRRHLNDCKRFMAPRPARPTRCMPANSR